MLNTNGVFSTIPEATVHHMTQPPVVRGQADPTITRIGQGGPIRMPPQPRGSLAARILGWRVRLNAS